MGRDNENVWNPLDRKITEEANDRPPWPQIGEYLENGILIRVFKAAWLEGVVTDHRVKPRKKKKD